MTASGAELLESRSDESHGYEGGTRDERDAGEPARLALGLAEPCGERAQEPQEERSCDGREKESDREAPLVPVVRVYERISSFVALRAGASMKITPAMT